MVISDCNKTGALLLHKRDFSLFSDNRKMGANKQNTTNHWPCGNTKAWEPLKFILQKYTTIIKVIH